jgi:hypothetical protein
MTIDKIRKSWVIITLTLLISFVTYQAHKTSITKPEYNHVIVVDKRAGGESGAKNSVHFGTYILLRHTATNKQETLFIENPFIADTYVIGNVYRYPNNPINIWEVGDLVGLSIISLMIILLVYGLLRFE